MYIKIPIIYDLPIFLISGRPEDVAAAKFELEADAYQITQYRAKVRPHETVTQCVAVPSSEHVARIVGENGRNIKRLKERAKIKIPARGEVPMFSITGRPEAVDAVKR